MFKHPRLSWLPFYMLVPLAAVLLFLDEAIPMPSALRTVILFAVVVLVCVLAVRWIERHPRLLESERLDTHMYSVVFSYPWPELQRSSSTTEDSGAFEDDNTRYQEMVISHVRCPSGD